METDLRDKFDSAFGAEPPARPVQDVVARGRRALRRRRIAVGAGALAVAALAATQLGQITGDPTTSPAPLGHPTPTPTLGAAALAEQKLTEAVPVDGSWRQGCDGAGQPKCDAYEQGLALVGLRPGGGLVRLSDEVIVLQRHDFGTGTTRAIYAVEVRPKTGHSTWYAVSRNAGGKAVIRSADPSSSQIDFEAFAQGVASGHAPEGSPPLTRETNPYAR